jgi:hypothetical protein
MMVGAGEIREEQKTKEDLNRTGTRKDQTPDKLKIV